MISFMEHFKIQDLICGFVEPMGGHRRF